MLFISTKGDTINTAPDNPYFDKVFDLVAYWSSKSEMIELQTSGSTGKPKTIIVQRSQIEASINMTKEVFNLSENDLFFCCLNVNYIAGMMMVFRALEIGADLIVVEPTSNPFENLGNQEHLVSKNRGKNFFSFVPLQLQTIIDSEKHLPLLKACKATIVGGAALNPRLEAKCQELNIPIYATYGMTETMSHIAIRDLRNEGQTFEVIKGVAIEVNTNDCLRICSPSTKDEWIQTNDVVELIDRKHFNLKGRIDNVINSGGLKIQLEQIEWRIAEKLDLQERYFCYGLKDERLGQKLILVIESEEIVVTNEQMQGIFGKFETPKEIYHLPMFLETQTAKIDKNKTVNEFIRN